MKPQTRHSEGIEGWLRLKGADNVGPVTFTKLVNRFGTVERVLGASAAELVKVEGIGYQKAEQIAASLGKFNVQAELELAGKLGVSIISSQDERYPPALKRIYDWPPVIYVKGDFARADNLAVAIVGSRRCSMYGREQAERFGHILASAGFTIVSGMATGIDTAAHRGALAAGGRTIAVQGCGLGNVFPSDNRKLSDLISQSGACVSELPLRYEPLAENFPPRNRIIAGLSLGVIVIEAASRSGALITAGSALENGREVMAVPGKIDSHLSRGSHRLLKQGAKLVESIDDVMEALGYVGRDLKPYVNAVATETDEKMNMPLFDVEQLKLSENEKAIYNCLGKEPMHLEDIIAFTELPAGSINAGLISLRLKGVIKQLRGSSFLKA